MRILSPKAFHQFAFFALTLLFAGVRDSVKAEVIYSAPGPSAGGSEVFPWFSSPFTDLSFFTNPGTLVQDFRSPGVNSILTSLTLDMGTASNTSGGFSVSIHSIVNNGGGSFDLPLVGSLTGTANPATAGSYTFTGLAPLNANTTYFLLLRVEDGGGRYVVNTSSSGPVVGAGGNRIVIVQNDSIDYITANGFNSHPFRLDDLALYQVSGTTNSFLMTMNAVLVDMEGGLQLANLQSGALLAGGQTLLNDLNNHLFNLRTGDGEEGYDDSLTASLDEGVIVGQGDGPEKPVARRVPRSRQWKLFTTVNYGNVNLNAFSGQAGVRVDSWAPGIGIERHLTRGLTLGFAAAFLSSHQAYGNGLGTMTLEGPALSAYLSYARRNFWGSLLYSFGTYDLDSTRNTGAGSPLAYGSTRAHTNAVQFNTGWNFRFQNNTLITGPYAGIDWLHGSIDGYSETGGGLAGLSYARQGFDSLVTRVGWSLSKKIRTDSATITPQVRVGYERQNLENNGTSVQAINAPFSISGGNQNPGQDYMVAGAGVCFAFNERFSLLLNYQGQFFRDNMQAHFGGVRLSYSF